MASLGFHTGLQTLLNGPHRGTQVVDAYFVPFLNQRLLERIQSGMRFGADLRLKIAPDTETHWIHIRRIQRPDILAPISWEMKVAEVQIDFDP